MTLETDEQIEQFKQDCVKEADENGGVSVRSLNGFTPEQIVNLLFPS